MWSEDGDDDACGGGDATTTPDAASEGTMELASLGITFMEEEEEEGGFASAAG